MDEDPLDPDAQAMALQMLAGALLIALPRSRAARLLIALSVAPERLESAGQRSRRAALRRARRWWRRELPLIISAVR